MKCRHTFALGFIFWKLDNPTINVLVMPVVRVQGKRQIFFVQALFFLAIVLCTHTSTNFVTNFQTLVFRIRQKLRICVTMIEPNLQNIC